jgi:hypothetical protein
MRLSDSCASGMTIALHAHLLQCLLAVAIRESITAVLPFDIHM